MLLQTHSRVGAFQKAKSPRSSDRQVDTINGDSACSIDATACPDMCQRDLKCEAIDPGTEHVLDPKQQMGLPEHVSMQEGCWNFCLHTLHGSTN